MKHLTEAEIFDMVLTPILSDPTHPHHRQAIAKLQSGETRTDIARFYASSVQHRNLHLKPWQTAPCDLYSMGTMEETIAKGEDPECPDTDYKTALLLREMLVHRISPYYPDPLSVLRGKI